MISTLEQLKSMTTVVADTGDRDALRRYQPVECTTNPSLVLAAFKDPASEALIDAELAACRKSGKSPAEAAATLTVAIGAALTELVPGRVSTEVDACLSFDTAASVARAQEIIADYASRGVSKDRVLIKLAATWEGIKAAEILERDGICCNLTLIFSLAQAVACADAKVTLISPFVGRITDWYKKTQGVTDYPADQDPGVASVRQIYDYYKSNGVETIVMGASFRSTAQVKALAGCDHLTIAPKLLEELASELMELPRQLAPDTVRSMDPIPMAEPQFRWALNADAMATEKLAEGIRNFDKDHQALIELISEKL